jgi:hypothetical protein
MTKKRYFLFPVLFCALLLSCSNGLRDNGSVSITVTMPSKAAARTASAAARTGDASSSPYTVDIVLLDSGGMVLQEQKRNAAAGEEVAFMFGDLPLGASLTVAGSVYLGTELYASFTPGSVTVSEEPQKVVLAPSVSTGTIQIVMPEIGVYSAVLTSASSGTGITVTLAVTKDGTAVTPESSSVQMFSKEGTDLAQLFSGYFEYDQKNQSFTIPSFIPAGTYSVFCSFTIDGIVYTDNGTFTIKLATA